MHQPALVHALWRQSEICAGFYERVLYYYYYNILGMQNPADESCRDNDDWGKFNRCTGKIISAFVVTPFVWVVQYSYSCGAELSSVAGSRVQNTSTVLPAS